MANEESKVTKVLFTTFLALNIVLVTVNLYGMYQRKNGSKKCKCQGKEAA